MIKKNACFIECKLLKSIRQIDDEQDLEKFAQHHNFMVKTEIASNTHTSPEDLDQLSKEDNFMIKLSIAGNANIRIFESILLRLATDKEFLIREKIAERYGLPE